MTEQPLSNTQRTDAQPTALGTDLSVPEFEVTTEAASSSAYSRPTSTALSYPSLPSKPEDYPDWYSPGYWTGDRVRSLQRTAGVPQGGPTGGDYTSQMVRQIEKRLSTQPAGLPGVAQRLDALAQQYPNNSPDMLLGLALTGAPPDPDLMSDDETLYSQMLGGLEPAEAGSALTAARQGVLFDRSTVGRIALPDGQEAFVRRGDTVLRDPQTNQVLDVVWSRDAEDLEGDRWSGLKTASKVFFAAMMMPYEGLVGAARNAAKQLSEGDIGGAWLELQSYSPLVAGIREAMHGNDYINPWEQTHAGQMILAAARGEDVDTGNGFFIAEDSTIGSRQIEAAVGAYELYGKGWTFGRALAGTVSSDPESTGYRTVSGIVDFTMALVADPTIWAAGLGIPSYVAKGATSTKSGATAIRALRKGIGLDPGEGTLIFGKAKRDLAKADAAVLRKIEGLEKAQREYDKAEEAVRRVTGDVDRIRAANAKRDEAAATLASLKEESALLLAERERLQLLDEVETLTKEQERLAQQQRETQYLDTIGTSPRLTEIDDEIREIDGRLALLNRLQEAGVGRGERGFRPGDTVRVGRGTVDWTIQSITDDGVELASEKGSRKVVDSTDRLTNTSASTYAESPALSREDLTVALLNLIEQTPPDMVQRQLDMLPALNQYHGNTFVDAPSQIVGRKAPLSVAVGQLDGQGVVSAWTAERAANLVRGGDAVPDDLRESLWDLLQSNVFAKTDDELAEIRAGLARMNFADSRFRDAAVSSLSRSKELGERIQAVLTDPSLTFSQAMDTLSERGLLPWFEVALRQADIDGVTDLLPQGGGTWFGYHPDIASYRAKTGRLADPDLNLSARQGPVPEGSRSIGQTDIGLVLQDTGVRRVPRGKEAVGRVAAEEASRLQAEIDTLLEQRTRIADAAADGRNVDAALAQVDAALADARARWQQATEGLDVIPEFSPTQRAQRIDMLRDRLRRNREEQRAIQGRIGKDARSLDAVLEVERRAFDQWDDASRTLAGLRQYAGAADTVMGRAVNTQATRSFLFGGTSLGAVSKAGAKAITALTNITSPTQLHRLTRWNLAAETVRDLTDNAAITLDNIRPKGGEPPSKAYTELADLIDNATDEDARRILQAWKEERVVQILSSRIGLDIKGSIGSGRLAPLATDAAGAYEVRQKAHFLADRFERRTPGTIKVDLADPKSAAEGLYFYMSRAGVDEKVIDDTLDGIFSAPEGAQAVVSRKIITRTFDELAEKATAEARERFPNLSGERAQMLSDLIKASTSVYTAGLNGVRTYWRHALSDGGIPVQVQLSDGRTAKLTNALLDSELARGVIYLPSPATFKKVTSRMGQWLAQTNKPVKNTVEFVDEVFSDFWRSWILFRGAYIVRNIAEMQMRNFLSGTLNIVSNPLAFAAMVFGPKLDDTVFGNVVKKMEPYAHDIHGYRFGHAVNEASPDEAEAANDALYAYFEMIQSNRALGDIRLQTDGQIRSGQMETVSPTSPRFNEAWSSELLLLRNSQIGRILAGGLPSDLRKAVDDGAIDFEEAVVEYLYSDSRTARLRDMMMAASEPDEGFNLIFTNRQGLRQYLFGGPRNKNSQYQRLMDITGGNERLIDFVRTGVLTRADGGNLVVGGKVFKGLPTEPEEARKALQGILARNYKDKVTFREDGSFRLFVPQKAPGQKEGRGSAMFNWFFRVSARMERITTMGPEFRVEYWNAVSEMFEEMTPKAQQATLKAMKNDALKLRRGDKPLMGFQQAYKKFSKTKVSGVLEQDDVHAFAMGRAQKHVENLYYDAHRRQDFFQSMRLLIPFGQAWYDTWKAWARLSAQNPTQLYKIQKAFDAGMDEGSNVIYQIESDLLGLDDDRSAPGYDPQQGFIFQDQFGEPAFYVPGMGTAIGALADLVPWAEDSPSLRSGFRMSGLNLLFGGGTAAPGLGPIATIPLSGVMDRATSNELLYDTIFPFAEPDLSAGALEAFSPAYFSRIARAIFDPNSPQVMQNMLPNMAHLITTGDYDVMTRAGQADLQRDALTLAKSQQVLTGVAQFFTITTPTRDWMLNMDGKTYGVSSLTNLFYNGYVEAFGGDYAQAQSQFLHDFGVEAITLLTDRTNGANTIREQGWEMVRKYPEVADAYPDAISALFPAGGSSVPGRQWQRSEGLAWAKNQQELKQEWAAFLYRTQRNQIRYNGLREGKTPELAQQELDALAQDYADVGVPGFDVEPASNQITVIKSMLDENPEMMREGNAQAFMLMFEARENYIAASEASGFKGASSAKSLAPNRAVYYAYLDRVAQEQPEAAQVAEMFKREVRP